MRIIYVFLAALLAYFLVVVQTSLLFKVPALISSLPLFVFVGVLSFFERPEEKAGFIAAFVGGFSLEMYSQYPFGLYLFSLLFLVLAVKILLKKYVGFSLPK